MDSTSLLTSGFLPFPDTRISSNLAPVTEEDDKVETKPNTTREDRLGDAERETGADDQLPPKKKRRMIFLCDACGTFYTEKRALARHRHTDTHRLNVGVPLASKYPCKLCGKEFSRDHDRQRHENEKHNGRKRSAKTKRDPSIMSFLSDDTAHCDSVTTMSMILDHDEEQTLLAVHPSAQRVKSNLEREDTKKPIKAQKTSNQADQQSWFAEQTDEETDGPADSTPNSQQSLQTVKSCAADSAVDMTEDLSEEQHEAKFPSITTHDLRGDFADVETAAPNAMTDETKPFVATSPPPVSRPRVSVIQRQGRLKVIPPIKPFMCVFCQNPFEDDSNDLLTHLRQHLNALTGELHCQTCKIGFVHKADLDSHQVKANVVGHCGFNFDHYQPCTGHHPPSRKHLDTEFTDRDAFRMCTQLRHWEQSQLQAYMEEIKDLVASRNSRASNTYTIEALMRRSRDSLSSLALSINTYQSAPCDVTLNGKTDVQGLQQRLRMMSLKDSTTQVRQTAKKLPHIVRSGSMNRAIYNAARNAELSQITLLAKLDAQPNAVVDNDSILSAAAQWANTETVRLLIELGASVNAVNGQYGTALNGAAFEGQADVVRYLITRGANVCQPGGKYGCALSTAAANGATEVMEILLNSGANVHQYGGAFGLPLNTAAACDRLESANVLLKHGADINRCAGSEGSALGYAIHCNHTAMVRQLLERGANPNGGSGAGKHGSPLCASIIKLATNAGSPEVVEILLSSGAEANAQGHPHGNALRTAALHADAPGMAEVVKLLLKHGADVHVSGQRGTALQLAKKRRDHWLEKMPFLAQDSRESVEETIGGCYEVIRLLREAGAGDGERKSSSSWR